MYCEDILQDRYLTLDEQNHPLNSYSIYSLLYYSVRVILNNDSINHIKLLSRLKENIRPIRPACCMPSKRIIDTTFRWWILLLFFMTKNQCYIMSYYQERIFC